MTADKNQKNAHRLIQAHSPEHIGIVRDLFNEYAKSLDFDLCFQNFDRELAELPGHYAPPHGRLLLALRGNSPAGCVALHRLEPLIAEMKRLYVRPEFRGQGLGRILAEAAISEARKIGYVRLRLDTVGSKMAEAVALYKDLGFKEIPAYRKNPLPDALYLERDL